MSFDCCADPKPRISDLDGRFFCASCHTWLSVEPQETPQEDGTGDCQRDILVTRKETP